MPDVSRPAGRPVEPPGRRLGDRYRLDRVIGRGSMGTVWAAVDEVLHRQVAIKQIDFPPGMPDEDMDQLERRTLREARAIAALSNPYVITLFDILTLPSGPVIVMELLQARSLADVIKQVGRLPDGQAATVGVAVASGLIAAHAAGITHRDVKPGNVLICDDGRIKLTDFGIARAAGDQTMTATGLLLGSPAYIAPEVAGGVPAGPISDAWGLGGLLFACTEGRPPFDQGTAIATLTSVVKDPVPPHPHSGRLGAVVSGLLVKTPNLRMRLDRALAIMRTVADDPSGMHLSLVGKLAAGRTPFAADAAPGAAGPATSVGPAGPPALRPTPPPPPRAAPMMPVQPGYPGPPTPPPATSTGTASAGTAPTGTAPTGTAPTGTAPTGTGSTGLAGPAAASPARPPAGVPSVSLTSGTVVRPPVSSLPPPPWAGQDSASLAPLPASAAPPAADRRRILVALLVALLAAAAGYFGVRAIADAAAGEQGAGAAQVVPL